MARPTKTEVLVSILGSDVAVGAKLVGELWDARVKAEFLVHPGRSKHFDYAKKNRIPWIIVVGEQEIKEGTVQLKSMETGNDVNINIPRENFVEELQKRLNSL
jgi:histidyl-tRNA synthetase